MREILYVIAIAGAGAGALLSARAEKVSVEPGQWLFEARVGRLSASGLPPGVSQAQLRDGLFGPALNAAGPACVTPRQAAGFGDLSSFRTPGYSAAECRATLSERSGETIRITGSCSDARGSRRDFTITGTIGPRNLDLLIHYDERSSRHAGHVEAELRFTGHRTGPCTGNAMAERPDLHGGRTGVEASNMAATNAAAVH